LSNHLAGRIGWDIDSVSSCTRSTTNKGVIIRGCPATVTDISFRHLTRVGVGSFPSNHSEPLESFNKDLAGLGILLTFLKAVVFPLGI